MIDKDCINLGLENIWQSWLNYRKGKQVSRALLRFQYNLEDEIIKLHADLNSGKYKHGGYRSFIVCDNKRRKISVAPIRDRVIHRLIYDHLVGIYDKTFIYDAWSCRKRKGLIGAIDRTQQFLKSFPNSYIWQVDIRKFFDSVNHEILINILWRRIEDERTRHLLREVITSFESQHEKQKGIPIGNLTSQIFANIYLNELDRFIKHKMKPLRYLRYGDDFIVIERDFVKLMTIKRATTLFLSRKLKLKLNPKKNHIKKVEQGMNFLGVVIYRKGRVLNKRNRLRIMKKLTAKNINSYYGLIKQHENQKKMKKFSWQLIERLNIPFSFKI
jgi:RNA-directed DNA polymerase